MNEVGAPLGNTHESISFNDNFRRHRHEFVKSGNFMVCSCGEKRLFLSPGSNTSIMTGFRSNGLKYTVRANRMRYLFPDEWLALEKAITDERQLILFQTLLHTGARIMEALHLKPSSFNFDRGTVKFTVVKGRAAKKKNYATTTSREFLVSPNYINKVKRYVRLNKVPDDQYLFLPNEKLPGNYEQLENTAKLKYYGTSKANFTNIFKRKLKKAGISNPEELSLHNMRKTYGNWMRVYNLEKMEICYRMGHDFDTFLAHYGSSLIFTQDERRKIMKICGDVR